MILLCEHISFHFVPQHVNNLGQSQSNIALGLPALKMMRNTCGFGSCMIFSLAQEQYIRDPPNSNYGNACVCELPVAGSAVLPFFLSY
jgi:hypothetical protein